jgi:hypothetical protein
MSHTAVGGASYTKVDPASTIESCGNTDVARDALRNATKGMTVDDAYMEAVITYSSVIT